MNKPKQATVFKNGTNVRRGGTTHSRIGHAAALSLLCATLMLTPAIASTATQTSAARTLSAWMDGWSNGTATSSPAEIAWRSGAAAAEALAGIRGPKKDKKPPKP